MRSHPDKILSGSQGNAQLLPNGTCSSAGARTRIHRVRRRRQASSSTAASSRDADSYRAYKLDWDGNPDRPPDLVGRTLYGSRSPRTRAGTAPPASPAGACSPGLPRELREVAAAEKTGFETAIDLGYLLRQGLRRSRRWPRRQLSPRHAEPSQWPGPATTRSSSASARSWPSRSSTRSSSARRTTSST